MAKATRKEKRHMNRVAEIGCIVCKLFHEKYTLASIHHVREGLGMGQRDHLKVIPLCPWHHQIGGVGVAIHASKKEFENNFTTEIELLKKIETLL